MFDSSQIPIWSLLIITIAIVVLWLLIRCKKSYQNKQYSLSSDYFEGLNYLLNDERDKALEVFVKLIESDWEIIDTHFALGKIYRKNGEMDKAIKIHQALIARPSLPEQYRNKILLELGYDYLDAGWLDRAEGLFKEVLLFDKESKEARRNLLLIYQQEKDWFKAIEIVKDMYSDDKASFGVMIAHYYCELADYAKSKGDIAQLEDLANSALKYDANCIRASILLADKLKDSGDDKAAIKQYQSIEKQDAESILLVINSLLECYENLSAQDKLYKYLLGLQKRHDNLYLQDVMSVVIERSKGQLAAIEYLSDKVKQQPSLSGINQLIAYKEKEKDSDQVFADLSQAVGFLLNESVAYKCQKCGFGTNTHYWLCPSCSHWGTIKPSIVTQDRKYEH